MRVLTLIVKHDPPTLEGNVYSRAFLDFLSQCLTKAPEQVRTRILIVDIVDECEA